MKCDMREELWSFSKEFYATSVQRLTQRWKKSVDSEGDCGNIISTL